MDCELGNIKVNLNKIKGFISRAREEKVSLLIFPELSLTGYSVKELVPEVAIRIDDPIIEDLKIFLTKKLFVVIIFINKIVDNRQIYYRH